MLTPNVKLYKIVHCIPRSVLRILVFIRYFLCRAGRYRGISVGQIEKIRRVVPEEENKTHKTTYAFLISKEPRAQRKRRRWRDGVVLSRTNFLTIVVFLIFFFRRLLSLYETRAVTSVRYYYSVLRVFVRGAAKRSVWCVFCLNGKPVRRKTMARAQTSLVVAVDVYLEPIQRTYTYATLCRVVRICVCIRTGWFLSTFTPLETLYNAKIRVHFCVQLKTLTELHLYDNDHLFIYVFFLKFF